MQSATNEQTRYHQKHNEAFGGDSEHRCDRQSTVHMRRIQFVFGCQEGSSDKEFPRQALHCVRYPHDGHCMGEGDG